MSSRMFIKGICGALFATFALGSLPAQSAEISNGGFENGDFSGWTVLDDNGLSGFACNMDDDDAPIPCGAWTISPGNVEPSEGNHYAYWNMEGPSWGILAREFDNSNQSGIDLTLDLLYTNGAEVWAFDENGPLDLGFRGECDVECEFENQWLRIEIIREGSGIITFDPEDILYSVFDGVSNDAPYSSQGWININIPSSVLPAGIFTLRIMTVNNLFYFPVGIDNVRFSAPEMVIDPLFAQDANFNQKVAGCRRDFTRDIQALVAPSLARYESCMFFDVTKSNIAGVNADALAQYKASVAAGKTMTEAEIITMVQELALRYSVIDRLINNPSSVYINDLVNIGLTGLNTVASKYQAINTLRVLDKDKKDTYEELVAAVAAMKK